MIRYLHGHDLAGEPGLRDGMFRDRAIQFRDRLKWSVTVDADGCERDEYDELDPLYAIWCNGNGRHGGSMRFLPTTGRTMVNEHFRSLVPGGSIQSPTIWECTRFCLSPDAEPRVAAILMLAGAEILRGFSLTGFVGVFDRRMERIYRRIGAAPDILGAEGNGRTRVSVGLWSSSPKALAGVARSAGLPPQAARAWFDAAFSHRAA